VNKYRNKRTEVDGIKFDSAKEARRYGELKLLWRAAEIRNFDVQTRYALDVGGIKIAHYVADFSYYDVRSGKWIVEDVKPTFRDEKSRKSYQSTAAYRMFTIKKQLMLAIHNIEVIEV
jgi:hypothetical protein